LLALVPVIPCFIENLNSICVPHAESFYFAVQSFLHGDSSDVAIRLNDFNCLQLVALVKRGFKEWSLDSVGEDQLDRSQIGVVTVVPVFDLFQTEVTCNRQIEKFFI